MTTKDIAEGLQSVRTILGNTIRDMGDHVDLQQGIPMRRIFRTQFDQGCEALRTIEMLAAEIAKLPVAG